MGLVERISGFAARIGLSGLAIAVLLALLAIQTVRIEGFKVWPIELQGWKPRALAAEDDLKAVAAAQVEAAARARTVKLEAEATYRQLAERIDDEAEHDRAGELAAAERFIAAGGLRRAATGSPCSRAAAPAAGDGAGSGQAAGRATELDAAAEPALDPELVTVLAEDVRICTVNTLQAEAARAWAVALEAATAAD